MCGFFLILKKKNIKKKSFLNSANLIKHRGPSHNSFYENKNIIVKFFRLSIRDVSKNSNQPIFSKDKRYIMVFNGEIYNTKYLIEKFCLNKKFNYKNDTQILFHLLCTYNTDILNDIKGMFSIVFFDNKKNSAFIIRDRFGMKPLYFSDSKDGIIISSELRSITNYLKNVKLNNIAVSDFFLRGYMDHNEETFFKNIKSLEPGNYIKIKNKSFFKYKYWELKKRIDKENFNSSLKSIREKTNLAVSQHLISDQKIGFFLSGGNDSKTIVKIAKKNEKKPNTITYEFEENINKKNNEYENALKSIKKSDWKNNFQVLLNNKNLEKKIYNLVKICEGPITSIRLLGVYESYIKAKEKNIKVILEGQCGDELLGGYLNNLMPSYFDKYDKTILKKKIFSKENINRFERIKLNQLYKCVHNQGTCTSDGTNYLNKNFFNKNFIKKYFKKKFTYANKNFKQFNHLQKSQYLEYSYIHTPRSLKYVDRISMSQGIECRVPYLDHELVEHCFNLSNHKKIKDNTQRYIFKRAFNLKDIKNKTEKKNITDPQRNWFSNKLNFLLRKELRDLDSNDKLFNKKEILNFLNNYENKILPNSFSLMTIYTFLIFKKTFNIRH